MTKLFLFLSFLFTLSAHAGLPSEDAAVAELRERFRAGRTPSVADLQLGKHWNCKSHNAIKGYNDVLDSMGYEFAAYREANGVTFVKDLVAERQVLAGQADASMISVLYAFNAGHFVAQPFEDVTVTRVHAYGRITADGTLLFEIASYLYPTLPKATLERRLSISEPATLFPELRLMGYESCRLPN